MFVDQAKIKIESGAGGHGHIGFYRAKYVTNGGPNGGDGGNGGSVVFVADTGLGTLMDFRHRRIFKGEPGQNGGTNNCTGARGSDCVILVPAGTIIRDAATGRVIADMARGGDRRVLAKGGRGGRGNQHFATPTRQAPKFAEDGKPGRSFEIILELKLIADAGIIGFPNAGKSTLLSMVTNAKPKIAGYQFTTLSPNLGVVRSDWGADFVLADIPGLIEGASEGIGLGHEFLRHIERTKVLVHVVDIAGIDGVDGIAGAETEEGNDPVYAVNAVNAVNAVKAINAELAAYNSALLDRPQIIAANKTDLLSGEVIAERVNALKTLGYPVFAISAATNAGLKELMMALSGILAEYPDDIVFEAEEEFALLEENREKEGNREKGEAAEASIVVERDEDGTFRVEGPGIERVLGYTNMVDEKGFAYFQKFMRDRGIIKRLEELGIVEGDTVYMYEFEFDYYP